MTSTHSIEKLGEFVGTLIKGTKPYLGRIGVLVENAHNSVQIDAELIVVGDVSVVAQEIRVIKNLVCHHRQEVKKIESKP